MATSKDIAKVFYKVTWMDGNPDVLHEFLLLLSKDYASIGKDPEMSADGKNDCKTIETFAKDLARLVSKR